MWFQKKSTLFSDSRPKLDLEGLYVISINETTSFSGQATGRVLMYLGSERLKALE